MPIRIEEVTYQYQMNTPFERTALRDVNVTIPSGALVAFLGHTGSGKSTLVQHMNGLLRPTDGRVVVDDIIVTPIRTRRDKKQNLLPLRRRVGLVFQYPEHQLFEETVERDVMFGPRNFGATDAEAKERAHEALRLVGLDETLWDRSPFDLSGGQMRRVAIAGVLASRPDVLIVDEPTAGLDPIGRRDMLALFKRLREELNLTLILVSHDMDDVLAYAERVIVMERGQVAFDGDPFELFQDEVLVRRLQLDIPHVLRFARDMAPVLGETSIPLVRTESELADWVAERLKGGAT
ncbi:energy-coupling factor transporter ATPase [Exiguobacterium profundum]|uniref:Energy-coupling factor transporter ATP-binding protein EcfA2 n=1 Tax=Exiguobacterium profundum TaxID=307643 RepID=A0ABY8B4F6_9BACL|nr:MULTISPECIES: energy-coupling factor transporter ATPase [Exiguobacterium]QPI67852.1 energy-coupling factor transporter ATPase [Exiguobacterium sp. PBE]MBG0916184.1 energy-coupling factor transporter ATPase [Exiguobacterium sp. SRB7LM]MBQ6459733.1 energy-coupling factor transporter ATPase [Exiguobacterium sp.]MBR3217200.1 energy-coupling factor transporter ATPase [Exiguobacterium sp.]MCM3280850.1 energy-coupling factor transporter ATPase [Exiguobacterium sp. MER 193]